MRNKRIGNAGAANRCQPSGSQGDTKWTLRALGLLVLPTLLGGAASARIVAQAPAVAGAPATASRQSGTVKAATDHDFVLTDVAGQDHAIDVPGAAKVLIVPPGSKDLSAATPGSLGDLQPGDRVLVNGKAGETGTAFSASRVVVMKSSAIAQTHAADEAAWTHGAAGLVKSVDAAAGTVMLVNGTRVTTVETTPKTIFRRYSGASVRFEDAVGSKLAAIEPGDQLRARGTRSGEGGNFSADEVVTGTFKNYSGEIASIDRTAGTLTLKDLTTKQNVTVAIAAGSNLRRLPPEAAARFAGREAGAAPGDAATGTRATATGTRVSATPASTPAPANSGAPGGPGRGGAPGTRGGADLSAIIGRLPTETLAGLKQGDAVMIVASAPDGEAHAATAITLLVGVEPILTAPNGRGTTLSPWSVGGGAPAEGEGAAAGPGR